MQIKILFKLDFIFLKDVNICFKGSINMLKSDNKNLQCYKTILK